MAATQPGAPQTLPRNPAAPLTQFAPTGPTQGLSQLDARSGGAYVQSVDPSSLVSNQYAALMRSDNPIVQQAALAAQGYAAARGGGVSGTQAIDASNRALFAQLEPVAEADAGRYAEVGNLNDQLLNQNRIEQMGNQTSITTAQIGAGAQRASTDERRHEFDIEQGNRGQDREWALADQDTQARASARSQFMNHVYDTIFSDPSVWRDPEGAQGMLNSYGSNFDAWFDSAFPEYHQDGANNVPSPPTPYQLAQGGG